MAANLFLDNPTVENLTSELDRLAILEHEHCLLPIGRGVDKKGPMLSGWERHPGYPVDYLKRKYGVIAIGIRCDHLWCIDYDGRSSIKHAKEIGLDPKSVTTWKVGRDNNNERFKLLFKPSQEQVEELASSSIPNARFHFSITTGDAEQLENFFTCGRQVIVLGSHWKSGGQYVWPEGEGPEALTMPPQDWWKTVIREAAKHYSKNSRTTRGTSSASDWKRLDECPICGRASHTVCSIHSDGETIRCFRGGTYAPPKLMPGESFDCWRYQRDQDVGWGVFAIFTKNLVKSPLQRWRRKYCG